MKAYIYAIVLVLVLSAVLYYNNSVESKKSDVVASSLQATDSTFINDNGFKDISIYPNREIAELVAPVDTITKAVVADNSKEIKPLLREVLTYDAVNNDKGIIGYFDGKRVDNPIDNVFHFNVTERYLQKSTAYIEYELYGVKDKNSVSKAVNDNYTYGGLVVVEDTVWSQQKEAVNLADLKMGHNVIRFTVPEESSYGYKIRNIKLVVDNKNLTASKRLVVNQPSTSTLKKQYGYINGFVKGKNASEANIFVNGEKVINNNGSFEKLSKCDSVNPVNFEVEVVAVFKDGKTLKEVVNFNKVGDYDFINNGEFTNKTQHTKFYRSEKVDFAFNGLSLRGESNTLKKTTTITASTLRGVDIPVMGSGMINTTGETKGFRLLPHGSSFAKEMRIGIPYDSASLPSGYRPEDIRSYYFNENNNKWTELAYDTVDKQLCVVYSYTNHFTDFINGIIKVPEAPQTNAYTPTSLSGMKPAEPLTGVNIMQPPSANSSGSANTGIQIKIPSGRQGMQPSLSINYSSDGGNGWMGVGWDLSIPSIDVETRWGVPMFSTTQETESYLIAGEQMTPMAHRGLFVQRFDDVQDNTMNFGHRIKGSFDTIVRHGTSPTTYWWEVTDRNGTKYLYGARSINEGLRSDLVIGSTYGIAHWALGAVIDVHDNNILYYYNLVQHADGKKLYPEHIAYTGYNGNVGNYYVYFDTHTDDIDYVRQDIIINARGGYVDVTANLLRSITIKYESNFIRKYKMRYKGGSFGKTVLCWIAEINKETDITNIESADCDVNIDVPAEAYFHRFNYHNNESTDFNEAVEITVDKDEKSRIFSGIDIGSELSLGQSGGVGNNLGGSLTVGIGTDIFIKSLSGGGGYTGTWGNSEIFLCLVDIDGDGLQDRVYSDNGKVYYNKLQYNNNSSNTVSFSNISTEIQGLSSIGLSNSKGSNSDLEGLLEFEGAQAGVGVNWSKNKNYTNSYFSDVNGDGLVDYIDNGIVQFNMLDDSGIPSFLLETGSETIIGNNPCNIVYRTGAVNEDVFSSEDVYRDMDELGVPFFNRDAVRVWIAPFDGYVVIDAPIQLIESTFPQRDGSYTADGVSYRIQHNNYPNLLASGSISKSDYSVKNIVQYEQVNKGDRLYFRLLSGDYRDWDDVLWNPNITYMEQGAITDNTIKDADDKSVFSFEASTDMLLSSKEQFSAPYNGVIQINGLLSSTTTLTDTVFLSIEKNGVEFYDEVLVNNNPIFKVVDITENVATGDIISIYAKTNTNIDFNALSDDIFIEYLSSTDVSINRSSEFDVIKVKPIIQYSIFQNTVQASAAPVNISNSGLKIIRPFMYFNGNANGKVVLAIKQKNKIIAEKNIYVQGGNWTCAGGSTIVQMMDPSAGYYFDFYSTDSELAQYLVDAKVFISEIGSVEVEHEAGFHVAMEEEMWKFGNMYRGWGQFSYSNINTLIDESELFMPDEASTLVTDPASIGSYSQAETELIDSGFDPMKYPFSIMTIDFDNSEWADFTKQTRVSSNTMNHTINFNSISSDIDVGDIPSTPFFSSIATSVNEVRAVRRMTIQEGNSYSVTGKVDVLESSNVNRGVSYMDGTSRNLMDYIDLNGDRYPDIVDKANVQYTNSYGGLNQTIYYGRYNGSYDSDYTNWAGTLGIGSQLVGEKAPSDKLSITPGAGASGGQNNDTSTDALIDINGDGLPDKIQSDNSVALNSGYEFTNIISSWGVSNFGKGYSTNMALNVGTYSSISHHSWSLGVAGNLSDNGRENEMIDMNGDGLVDLVQYDKSSNELSVSYNLGNKFKGPETIAEIEEFNSSATANFSGSAAATFGIPIWVIKLGLNGRYNRTKDFTHEKWKLTDFNNDGYVDIVYVKDDKIKVKYSKLGLHNVLQSIETPTSAEYSIEYSLLTSSDKDMPNRKWVMSSVNINDGLDLQDAVASGPGDGSDNITFKYEYENPYYDRYERTFFGFEKVINNQVNSLGIVYRTTVDEYINDNFYYKGKKKVETAYSDYYATPKVISNETVYTYKEVDCDGETDYGFPALFKIDKYFYDGNATAQIHTRQNFEYDKYANISKVIDERDVFISNDNVESIITYNYIISKNILSLPIKIEISDGTSVLRSKTAKYNQDGDLITVTSGSGSTNMDYDKYGNIIRVEYPANNNDERVHYDYQYDAVVNAFNTSVIDVFGNESTAVYDYRIQAPTSTTDISGNSTYYDYYIDGKPKTVTGPKEIGNSTYSIKYEYGINSGIYWAKTSRKNTGNQPDIYSISYSDGLGRTIQTKKSAYLNGSLTEVVSGRIIFDEYGRVIKSYYPIDIASGMINAGISTMYDASISPTIISYDKMDRRTLVTMPDNTTTSISYGFGVNSSNNNKEFQQITTNALNKSTVSLINVLGKQTELIAPGGITTRFEYNLFGELVKSTDPENNNTTYIYDNLGRLLSRAHPDAGTTSYTYDNANNLTSVQTANLAAQNNFINYFYDYNRLVKVEYPNSIGNDVYYEYGDPNTGNQAGKLTKMQDASGVQEFIYGNMGELIENIHTFATPAGDPYTFNMKWTYDSWNRIQDITYPDGEVLSYAYQDDGMLNSMTSVINGQQFDIINEINYDKFGNKKDIEYGNGTKTYYTYDNTTRRLSNLLSKDNNNVSMQNINYTYDLIGNITNFNNSANSIDGLGGNSSANYVYDDLSRLVSADIKFTNYANTLFNKKSIISYSDDGNIIQKELKSNSGGGVSLATEYLNNYNYNSSKPHAVDEIDHGDENTTSFTWDANGNMTNQLNNETGMGRSMCWDEENRLTTVRDDSYLSNYIYNAGGERVWKLTGDIERMSVNGEDFIDQVYLNKTLYVSPYMVVSDKEYTKHYYAGSQRIMSKIGGGFANTTVSDVESMVEPFDDDINRISDQLMENIDDIACNQDISFSIDPQFEILSELVGSYDDEYLQYFYHTDHLGSSSWITDGYGYVNQYIQNLAYGEDFINQRSKEHDIRYKFTGKERDVETGLDYFGARYYSSDLSIWLSVDPLASMFPNMSPYMYVAGNPIMLIDKWGLKPEKGKTVPPAGQEGAYSTRTGQKWVPKYYNSNTKKSNSSLPTLPKNWSASRTFNYSSAKPNLTFTQMNKNRNDFYSRPRFNLNYNKTIRLESINVFSNSTISSYGFTTLSLITSKTISIINNESVYQQLFNNTLAKQAKNLPGEIFIPIKMSPSMKFIGKWGGTPFAVWGALEIGAEYREGNITGSSAAIELFSTAVGAIPLYGNAWSIGWNLGKLYGPSTLFNFNYY